MAKPLPAKTRWGGRRLGDGIIGATGAARAPSTTRLEWLDIFETGNAEIDAMHRKLVEDCNDLLRLVEVGADWPRIVAVTRQLVADCIEHFQVEDSLLERMKFPRREAHMAEHRRMEQDLRGLIARMEQVDGSLKEHRDLPASLGPSIIDLMIRHDLDYRSHVLHFQGR
jgi:hemerythrin-like metal-binding protein